MKVINKITPEIVYNLWGGEKGLNSKAPDLNFKMSLLDKYRYWMWRPSCDDHNQDYLLHFLQSLVLADLVQLYVDLKKGV